VSFNASGVAKGKRVRARASGRRAWRRINALFQPLKTCF